MCQEWLSLLSEDLRQKLVNLGLSSQLFTIRPGEDCDLYLEHTIVDAKYYGVASQEKISKRYSAKMWLVELSLIHISEPTRPY